VFIHVTCETPDTSDGGRQKKSLWCLPHWPEGNCSSISYNRFCCRGSRYFVAVIYVCVSRLCWIMAWFIDMFHLMPLPLTVCCFSKIQIGFAFLIPAHPGSPGQRAVKRVCVCVCVSSCRPLVWWWNCAGICSPRFLRSTMYNIPCTNDLLKQTHVPFALVLSPFSQLAHDEVCLTAYYTAAIMDCRNYLVIVFCVMCVFYTILCIHPGTVFSDAFDLSHFICFARRSLLLQTE